jgi:hypothetical protein
MNLYARGKRLRMRVAKKSPIPAERVALYEKLVASLPGVERKGADNPYTAINGNCSRCSLAPRAGWDSVFQKTIVSNS